MRKKRFTAADRPEFRRELGELLQKHDIKTAEISSDMGIVCCRAADFDPQSNVLWEAEANWSAARPDVLCLGCKSSLAMSNHAYAKWAALDRKPKTYCIDCMLAVTGHE